MTQDELIHEELKLTAKRMAERMIKAAQRLGIGVTGKLIASIQTHVTAKTLQLNFNYYGRFVDMGVGRGISLDELKALGKYSTRKPKPFYSSEAYSEAALLRVRLAAAGVTMAVKEFEKLSSLRIELH